ncbi:rho guanine nucleotide exchange factor 39 [Protopterus annectens]|uniref:rho guanine nucleotide exchange factor 39 n=1 Tax=Protopterus annectens TaxID=7888 RepID=UPI001CFBC2C8|nr:rho guanine nucleotide exchange factor 39 [Protopterus annectens]
MELSTKIKSPVRCNTVENQRLRWERKWSRTAKELVETEQRYSEQLELIKSYFIDILKAKGTLKEDTRKAVFGSLESICLVNQTLLVYLEEGKFGIGFEEFCPHLHLYASYAENMEYAVKVLQEQIRKNKAFVRFKKLQESRPEFMGMKLEDLLPLPMQRIYKYKHFLEDLTANTSPDSTEFKQLTKAVNAVYEVSQHIQDRARSHENYLQMLRVQKLLKGRKTKVLASGRWFLKEGWLTVVPHKGEEVKHRMCFLFSDILLLAKPCHSLHPLHAGKFDCQSVYPLIECRVEKVFGHTRSQGGLISLTFEREKLLLMSNDQGNVNDWYRCLSAAIGQLKSRITVVHKKHNQGGRAQQYKDAITSLETISDASQNRKKQNLRQKRDKSENSNSQCSSFENESHVSKRRKLTENPSERFLERQNTHEVESSACTIL